MVADVFVAPPERVACACPVCGAKHVETVFREEHIPHFGRVVISTSFCRSCGFRRTDIYEVDEKGPATYVLRVDSPEKLNYYVVRSSTARIEIPEIGMELTPGPFSQGFITTVEGVLHRFLDVLSLFSGQSGVQRVEEFLKGALEGKRPFTLVLEDPRGLSRIVGEGVEVRGRGGGSSPPRGAKTP